MKSLCILLIALLSVSYLFGKNSNDSLRWESGKAILAAKKNIREFTITENDTLSYTLKLALDDSGRPQYFFRNIFTPVCYTNECKPVYVNFKRDLLKNYVRKNNCRFYKLPLLLRTYPGFITAPM